MYCTYTSFGRIANSLAVSTRTARGQLGRKYGASTRKVCPGPESKYPETKYAWKISEESLRAAGRRINEFRTRRSGRNGLCHPGRRRNQVQARRSVHAASLRKRRAPRMQSAHERRRKSSLPGCRAYRPRRVFRGRVDCHLGSVHTFWHMH